MDAEARPVQVRRAVEALKRASGALIDLLNSPDEAVRAGRPMPALSLLTEHRAPKGSYFRALNSVVHPESSVGEVFLVA